MSKMIKADLRRVMKKISFYIWYVNVFLFTFLFSGLADYSEDTLQIQFTICGAVLPVIVSIPVFLAVYGDEMKSGTMQCIIGRGISRSKVILAKFVDCVLLAGFFFFMIEIVMYIRNILFDVGYTQTQTLTVAFFLFVLFLRTVGYLAFASFFVFFSWSTAPGVIALLTFSVLARLTLQTAQTLLKVPVYDFSFDGFLDAGFTAASAGNFAYQFALAAVFIVGALILTMIVFRKKEIEF